MDELADLIGELQRAYGLLNGNLKPRQADGLIHLVVARLPNKTKIEVRFEKNHRRPHFHAKCGDKCDVSVDIQTVEILIGKCEPKHWRIVRDWAFYKKAELLTVWEKLREQQAIAFDL